MISLDYYYDILKLPDVEFTTTDGIKNGTTVERLNNHSSHKLTYKDNLLNGPCVKYYYNHVTSELVYENGELVFHEEYRYTFLGTKRHTTVFRDSKVVYKIFYNYDGGISRIFEVFPGNIRKFSDYHKGKLETMYYRNANHRIHGPYRKIHRSKNGEILKTTNLFYRNGTTIRFKEPKEKDKLMLSLKYGIPFFD